MYICILGNHHIGITIEGCIQIICGITNLHRSCIVSPVFSLCGIVAPIESVICISKITGEVNVVKGYAVKRESNIVRIILIGACTELNL